jgi:hypothetical protein
VIVLAFPLASIHPQEAKSFCSIKVPSRTFILRGSPHKEVFFMSDDKALLNESVSADSTPPPIGQPDHIAPDPTATPSPDDSPNLVRPPRSLTSSDGSSFLGPLFTSLADSIDWDYNFAVAEGLIREGLSWVPSVLAKIIDSDISPAHKQHWLQFFLRHISIIIMVNDNDPREYAEELGDLVPAGNAFTKESIFASLLSELTHFLAIKDSEYVFYDVLWDNTLRYEPGEVRLLSCIYESLANYLARFLDPPTDH